MSEATFYKHELASSACWPAVRWPRAASRRQALAGFAISYATGLWPAAAQPDAGLVLSNLLWKWTIRAGQEENRPLSPFTAGRDGADVWPGMENRRCRRGTWGVAGDAVFC